jgi:hypothetical protein
LIDQDRDGEERFMKILWAAMASILIISGLTLAQNAAPDNSTPQMPPNNSSSQTAPQSQPQQGQANPGQPSDAPRIAPGSVIPVQLTKTIDAKKVKTGDPVEAKVTQDLKTTTGVLLVPKDTKMMGHVTQAQARNKEQKESQLGLSFDHAVMKNGSDVPLPMSIQAVIAPPTLNDTNSQSTTSQPTSAGGNMPENGSARPGATAQTPSSPATNGVPATDAQAGSDPRQAITGDTQGVVGMPNVKLAATPSAGQGSVLSSEKNNVKLESGTFLLLKVNQ